MESFSQEIPNQFLCPISLEIMVEPVICQDGFTYERKSIVDLIKLKKNSSPMTREPMDLNIVIPNMALKQIIETYAKTNCIKLKKSSNNTVLTNSTNSTYDENLANLQRQRESMLEKYEGEQKEKYRTRAMAIEREKQEQRKKQQEEKERKLQIAREKHELQRVANMFNSRDLPILHAGGIQLINNNIHYWVEFIKKKFVFDVNVLLKIKHANINELYRHYTKLCNDIIWIKKYVYASKDTKPFVDYVYDFWNDENKLDDIIDKLKIQINSEPKDCSSHRTYCLVCSICNKKQALEAELKEYTKLKNNLTFLRKPREYYYVNYEEFLNTYKSQCQYTNQIYHRGPLYDSFHTTEIRACNSPVETYFGNKAFYNIYHIWDREQLDKINFFVNIAKYIGLINNNDTNYQIKCCGIRMDEKTEEEIRRIYRNGTYECILDHIQYILFKKNAFINRRFQLMFSSDFDDLIKIGMVIVELIEFIRPEVILMN